MKQESQTKKKVEAAFAVELLEERIAPRLAARSINGPIWEKPKFDDMIP